MADKELDTERHLQVRQRCGDGRLEICSSLAAAVNDKTSAVTTKYLN